jgi:small subunit ribosomal protein S2
MNSTKNPGSKNKIDAMFSVGAHFGYIKSRRHPTTAPFIFGRKNNVEIFDLEKTAKQLEDVKAYIAGIAKTGGRILFVGGKREAQTAIKEAAEKIDMPFVAGRWIGGTLTNFTEIRKRIDHYTKLLSQKEKGELVKYKKKERLLIDREIAKLEERFSGIVSMDKKPAALFIIDADKEHIAREEALQTGVPIISLANTDCDYSKIDHVIPGNDSSVDSIKFFLNEVVESYKSGKTA